MPNGGHPRLGFPCGFEGFDVTLQSPEQRVRFKSRQHAPHAGVHAVSPPEMRTIVATHVESFRILPFARVTIGRGK
jgi:hypothetical protein